MSKPATYQAGIERNVAMDNIVQNWLANISAVWMEQYYNLMIYQPKDYLT